MGKFTWFDILFYATYRLMPLNKETYRKLAEVSKKISDETGGTKKRSEILIGFLVDNEMFQDTQTSNIKKFIKDKSIRDKIAEQVKKIYDEIKNVQLEPAKKELYGKLLSDIISTGGKVLSDKKIDV